MKRLTLVKRSSPLPIKMTDSTKAADASTYIEPTIEIQAISPIEENISLSMGPMALNIQPGNELTQVVARPI